MNNTEDSTIPNALNPAELPAPRWLNLAVYCFRLGLGVFLALSLLLSGCAVQAAEFWQPATAVLTPEQIKVIVAEHSSLTIDQVTPQWIDQTQVHLMGQLILMDFNTSGLCGSGGCLYVGYRLDQSSSSLKQVLYLRLHPQLPPGVSLFTSADESLEELPCLTVHQMQDDQVQEISFCFDGNQYVRQSSAIVLPRSQSSPQKSLNHEHGNTLESRHRSDRALRRR
jgi:hypothetical protein